MILRHRSDFGRFVLTNISVWLRNTFYIYFFGTLIRDAPLLSHIKHPCAVASVCPLTMLLSFNICHQEQSVPLQRITSG